MNAVTFPVLADPATRQSEAREKALGLRELRYFLSVAQTGNLGRAARDLNISQPAISLQLRKLEEGFGTPLMLRHGRGVTLTPAGASLRDRLHTVMRLLASPLDDAPAETMPSTICLAVPAETSAPLITPLALAFRARWPDVTLDIREGSGADLEEWLLHRHVDLAILQDPPSLPDIEIKPMLTESLGFVAPVHSKLAADTRPMSLRELGGESLILPGPQHWIRRRVRDRRTTERHAAEHGAAGEQRCAGQGDGPQRPRLHDSAAQLCTGRDCARCLGVSADRPAAAHMHKRDRISPRGVEHAGAGIRRHGVRRDGHAGRERRVAGRTDDQATHEHAPAGGRPRSLAVTRGGP